MADNCPKCGSKLDFDEVDIGVGIQRGNYGCPDCHWTPEGSSALLLEDEDEDDIDEDEDDEDFDDLEDYNESDEEDPDEEDEP